MTDIEPGHDNHDPWECAGCFERHEAEPITDSPPHEVGEFDPDNCEVCWLWTK